jgi:hypothetical protein
MSADAEYDRTAFYCVRCRRTLRWAVRGRRDTVTPRPPKKDGGPPTGWTHDGCGGTVSPSRRLANR